MSSINHVTVLGTVSDTTLYFIHNRGLIPGARFKPGFSVYVIHTPECVPFIAPILEEEAPLSLGIVLIVQPDRMWAGL